MKAELESATAVFAAAFAGMLCGADAMVKAGEALNPKTAKELAVRVEGS